MPLTQGVLFVCEKVRHSVCASSFWESHHASSWHICLWHEVAFGSGFRKQCPCEVCVCWVCWVLQLGANMGPLMYRRWSVTMHAVPCLLSLCSAVTEPVLESLCGAGYRACVIEPVCCSYRACVAEPVLESLCGAGYRACVIEPVCCSYRACVTEPECGDLEPAVCAVNGCERACCAVGNGVLGTKELCATILISCRVPFPMP